MELGNYDIAIVIPFHLEVPNEDELKSLNRAIKVFSKREFILVCPFEIKGEVYFDQIPVGISCTVERFEPKYFRSVEGYNSLLISSKFYYRFRKYDYIFIHQLDCYAFRDDLDYWANKGFDYIGAPWFNNKNSVNYYKSLNYSNNKLLRFLKSTIDFNNGRKVFVGNGGVSLRKLSSFLFVSRFLKFLVPKIRDTGEDFIWSILVPKYFKSFKIPEKHEASQFALEEIEDHDKIAFGDYPMACHAWQKYYPEIWSQLEP